MIYSMGAVRDSEIRMPYTLDIRTVFKNMLRNRPKTTRCELLEIINASFIADEPAIFGTPDEVYIKKELDWYLSQDPNIHSMPDYPKIWDGVKNAAGETNSNYGQAIFSPERCCQYDYCLDQLVKNRYTKRACMIYNMPGMQTEYAIRGKNDFICTWSVSVFVRRKGPNDAYPIDKIEELVYCVNMRSNDAVYGYKNDYAWHKYVYDKLYADLKSSDRHFEEIIQTNMLWFANSLHIYPRHFHLIHPFRG